MITVVCMDPRCTECSGFWDTQLGLVGAEAPDEAQ